MSGSSAILPRLRLVERLGVPGEGGAPLSILAAPVGYGKTTLLERWIQSLPKQIPVASVQAADIEDSEGLWKALCEELDTGRDKLAAGEGSGRAKRRVEAWVESLCSPAVIVIDDYQNVTSPELDQELFELLLSSVHLFAVVSGRTFARLDTPLVTAQIETRMLTVEDLAFSEEEIPQLPGFSVTRDRSATREALMQMRGWPLASRVLLDPHLENSEKNASFKLLAHLDRIVPDPATRKVLLLLSVGGETSEKVLVEISGVPPLQLQPMLTRLLELGLVEQTWRSGKSFYSPHPAFLTAKSLQNWGELTESEIAMTIRSQTQDMAQYDPVGAFSLLMRKGMIADADQLALFYFPQLILKPTVVYPLVADLDLELMEDFPLLLGLRAIFAQPIQSVSAQELDRIATAMVASVRKMFPPGEVKIDVRHHSILIAALRLLGQWDEVEKHSLQLEARLAEQKFVSYWKGQSSLPLMYSIVALTGLMTGDLELAKRTSERGLSIAESEGNHSEQLRSLNCLALLAAIAGDIEESKAHLNAAEVIKAKTGAASPELTETNAYMASATLALLQGDSTEGIRILSEVVPVLDLIEPWKQFVILESWLLRFENGSSVALEKLKLRTAERRSARLSPVASTQLVAMLANLSIYSGDLEFAQEILSAPVRVTDELLLAQARLDFVSGNLWDAYRGAHSVLSGSGGAMKTAAALLIGACALFEVGDAAGALELLVDLRFADSASANHLVLSTVPYGSLKRLANASNAEGDPSLLTLIDSLPEHYRFREPVSLSPAEQKTLRAVVGESTLKAAAVSLGVSPNTVKSHLRQIYTKLDVTCRADMETVARQMGLV